MTESTGNETEGAQENADLTAPAAAAARTEAGSDGRPPLLPLSASAEREGAVKEKENEEKDRRSRDGDDRDRQNREVGAGLHPLQVLLVLCVKQPSHVSELDNVKT